MLKLLASATVALGMLMSPALAAAKKIALVLPGPITDGTFNSAANKGIQAAKSKYDIDVVIRENTDFAQIEDVLRSYAEEGYDMVIGHGFQFAEPVMNIHADYPKTFFVVNTAQVA
ncbi:MAG: BMP family ABC transporter substrate-binding protein, partial [Rhizobiaceae bacterium]|nr:BMP family ABC transporter substrate-binding protein [Rhizobiaceae bacterium]